MFSKLRLTSSIRYRSVAILFLILLLSHATRADEIAVWNFNDSDLLVDHGNGTLATNFNLTNVIFTLGGTTTNARLGDPAGQSMTLQGGTSNSNNGRFINLAVSTLGYANIIISLATQATGTGFNNNQLQYSTDGVNFVNFGGPYAPPTAFGLFTFDLSAITALNDNPNAAFRIVFNGATSSTGNNRIDNIVVDGQSVGLPEPSSIFLLGLGMTGAAGYARKRRRRLKGK